MRTMLPAGTLTRVEVHGSRTMLHATLLRVVPERSTAKHLASFGGAVRGSCTRKHATACVASRLTTPPPR